MDHKPENDATDTKDTVNDIKSVDNNQSNTDDIVAPSEKNTPEKKISKPKKKKSIIMIIIILIIFIAIAASLFMFCYDKNLAGVRDITNTAYQKIFPNQPTVNNVSQNLLKQKEDKNLNATSSVVKNNILDSKQNTPIILKHSVKNEVQKPVQKEDKLPVQPVQKTESTLKTKLKVLNPETSLDDFLNSLPEVFSEKNTSNAIPVAKNIKNDNKPASDYQNLIKKQHAQAKSMFKQFNSLNNQFSNGDPYFEALITLKTQLKKSNISIPTLTEYASGGFPTDIIIVSDALKSLKRLAIMQSRQQPANTLENIIGRFMVITPTSNIKGFSGKLYGIKKALNDADFDTVLEEIKTLSPQKQKTFNSLKIVIQDKKKVQTELNQLNDAIIDDIFTLNQ